MSALLSAAGIHVRRSPALGVAPLAGVFTAIYAIGEQPSGLALGSVVSASLMASGGMVGPVAAGTGAWLAVRERRWRLDLLRDLSVRPRWLDPLLEIVVTVLLIASAYWLAVASVVIWWERAPHTYGAMQWWGLVATSLGIGVHAVAGRILGSIVPHPLTAPAVVILTYVLDAAGAQAYGRPWNLWLPVIRADPDAFNVWRPGAFESQSLWLAALLAVLLGVVVLSRSVTRTTVAVVLVSLGVAVLSLALLVPHQGRWYSDRAASFRYACRGTSPQVCVHPAYRAVAPGMELAFTDLMAKAGGTPLHAARLEQRPRGIGGEASPGAAAIHFDDASPATSAAARQEYVESFLGERCWTGDGAAALPWMSVVGDWLMDAEAGRADDGSPAARARSWFSAQDEEARRAWLREHAAAFLSCRLSDADFR